MGQRGPKPLPGNVHRLRGNPSKLSPSQLAGELEPDIEIPDCPPHLLKEARSFWRKITPELERYGLISKLDQAALALACQEWGWVVYHEAALQADLKAAQAKASAWAADPANEGKPWAGGDGFMLPTPNGNWTYNPHWVGRNRHVLLLDKFLASFGLSPSARGRVRPSSAQLQLPGVEPKDGFGAL